MKTILYLSAMGEISGAERSLLAMLDALDRDAWLPVVAAPAGPLLAEVELRGVRALPLPVAPLRRPHTLSAAWVGWGTLQRGWRAVAAAVATTEAALVHANTTPAMLYALHAPRVPVVWQVRDLAPLGHWAALCARRAAQVAVISTAVRRQLLRYAREEQLTLLPPAVDTAHFQPAADRRALRRALGLPADGPLLGLVAQFVPWKRHHLFLDVLESLADRPWHAVLAGADLHHDQAYLASLQARISKPPLAGRVTRVEWQSDPAPLIAALDLCVLTSQQEPFGRVLIEAMACGVPVVAVDEGGARDIVLPGATGLLAPAERGALAEAVTTLLDDTPCRAAFGAAGRARAEELFSLSAHRAALSALYQRCVLR